MVSAAVRILMIFVISLIWLVLAIYSLRLLGSNQKYEAHSHPLIASEKKWVIIENHESQSTKSAPHIAFARLFLSKDGSWVVAEKNFVGPQRQSVNSLTLNDLKAHKVESIESWVQMHPAPSYYFFIEDSGGQNLEAISKLIRDKKLEQSVLIGSHYANIITKMRKIEPLWLYGAPTSEVSRLRFFSSLFLEPLATLNSDFVVIDKIPNPRFLSELKKRKKKFIFQPKNKPIDAELSQKSDGIFVQTVDQVPVDY